MKKTKIYLATLITFLFIGYLSGCGAVDTSSASKNEKSRVKPAIPQTVEDVDHEVVDIQAEAQPQIPKSK